MVPRAVLNIFILNTIFKKQISEKIVTDLCRQTRCTDLTFHKHIFEHVGPGDSRRKCAVAAALNGVTHHAQVDVRLTTRSGPLCARCPKPGARSQPQAPQTFFFRVGKKFGKSLKSIHTFPGPGRNGRCRVGGVAFHHCPPGLTLAMRPASRQWHSSSTA